MNILKDKTIIYDDACALCSGLQARAVRYGIVGEEDCVAWSRFSVSQSGTVDPARFRNEMALVDRNGRATLYGMDGLMHIFSVRYPLLRPMLSHSSIRALLHVLYTIVAPNRYVIATPPAHPVVCSCVPDVSARVRLRYILSAHLFAIIATVMFGLAIRPLVPEVSAGNAVAGILLITGTGWALHLLLAAVFLPRLFVEYTAHLTSVMWRGVLPLAPVMLLSALSIHSIVFVGLCVAVSSGWMIFQHGRRTRALCLPRWWTLLWYTCLAAGALFWLSFFRENLSCL